eukprot:scaffold74896_cov78-Cyclotella_meneghiniana.AAC.5
MRDSLRSMSSNSLQCTEDLVRHSFEFCLINAEFKTKDRVRYPYTGLEHNIAAASCTANRCNID